LIGAQRAGIAARTMAAGAAPIAYEEAPLGVFHLRVAAASTGGVFCDGFGLGIIGTALGLGAAQLEVTPLWLGLLGGASLAGLFLGALVTGPVADQFGRRPVFAFNMALLGVLSALQFFAASSPQLLALRLLIGFVLGTDYVVSKAMLTEFTPRPFRGRILSALSVAWAAGYTCAYFAGYLLAGAGAEPWRWMLLASAVPCLAILPIRITMPESPLWLADHGHAEDAARVVLDKLGPRVMPPPRSPPAPRARGRWRQLASPAWRLRTLVGCAFFTCLVIPYFAVGTFVARVLAALHVQSGAVGGLVYNLALLAGAIAGLLVVDRISRRAFLVGSFALAAASLLAFVVSDDLPPALIIALFAILAGTLSAASDLVYVYLPELFPTDLRASGIGLAIAASRVGSAVSTFLLPVVVADFGVRAALGSCMAVLVLGGIVCQLWAPETRHARLAVVGQP
jgi:putative MFS transporter